MPAAAPPAPLPARATEPPGGLLVWLIVVLEVFTFGVGLVAFILQRGSEPAVFRQGRDSLNQGIALANTLVLLTGGWAMANGLTRLRAGHTGSTVRWLDGAIAAAATFLVLKGCEYADKLHHGQDLHAGPFFTFYWLLTGFHFLHVAAAAVLLAAMRRGVARGHYTAARHEDVEGSGIFWHLCDLVWLLLYPVLYLLQ